MYAIFVDGGRQFKVHEGDLLEVDFRAVSAGEKLVFNEVLAVGSEGSAKIGSPTVKGAKVTAKVVGPEMGPKLTVQKFRRRKNSRRHTGHRQVSTRVEIEKISG